MRVLSFILAFGFTFAAPSFDATADSKLPGAGAFTYGAASTSGHVAQVAHLTLNARGRMAPVSTKEDIRSTSADVARG